MKRACKVVKAGLNPWHYKFFFSSMKRRSIDRRSSDLYLQISASRTVQEQSSAGAKVFRGAPRPHGKGRLATHNGPTVGPESHPAFGVYLTNKARRGHTCSPCGIIARARSLSPEREERSALHRSRLTMKWQRALFRPFAASSPRSYTAHTAELCAATEH